MIANKVEIEGSDCGDKDVPLLILSEPPIYKANCLVRTGPRVAILRHLGSADRTVGSNLRPAPWFLGLLGLDSAQFRALSGPTSINYWASPSDENPTQAKFQDMLLREPWAGIVSNVKLPIHRIKEKYFIPNDYEVRIPRKFDRMHRPPVGFCPFFLLYFEAGLRLP
ncbi:UNVERIFIED_CONTAM: hypothetical protein Sradi_4294600 [Sesamum radiatum]|uniref:Uncharacterized protein n=1 Tax=Sesamum radiatum TaxID=300843 RepID=A0AAW2NP21_SESRA